MIKKCSRCNAPAPDIRSVFCSRCGARLPPDFYCHACRKKVAHPGLRFCDHCGSPLVPALVDVPPITLAMGRICPACSYENFTENALFCRKCGGPLRKGGDGKRRLQH